MAAACYPPRADDGALAGSMYPRVMMSELQLDHRFPIITKRHTTASSDLSARESTGNNNEYESTQQARSDQQTQRATSLIAPSDNWDAQRRTDTYPNNTVQARRSPSQQSQQSLRYAIPPAGAARRVVERYSLEDNNTANLPSTEMRQSTGAFDSPTMQQQQQQQQPQQQSRSPSARQSLVPYAGVGAASSSTMVPISPNHRAYAQHPVYITPPAAPNPINPVFSPPPPQEEVCLECAMRDQDMIDIDVTSPGIWERESDAQFEDLIRQEKQEHATGTPSNDPSRPKSQGGRLTEPNVKLWLSVNPREIAGKQHTLEKYVKAQRKLLEAEAMARSRAMQESRQLDNRMRDAYSELRQSAYDLGTSSAPVDDSRGVRIKPPRSPTDPINPVHTRSQSREITLLENGMIVEHVDVRKEEKEIRERKRKEERRARKSSRGSMADVTSVYSIQSLSPPTENGSSLKPYSRYSQTSSARPTSVLTAPLERPEFARGVSQSYSDVHSVGSGSPRRTRFFGFKNLSSGWRSTDSLAPSGMSGSMMDMHVALQREAQGQQFTQSPTDMRRSNLWPPQSQNAEQTVIQTPPTKKKKGGLKKIWRIVTGSSKHADTSRTPSQSFERQEDDLPLAPPPPLSYLVDRRPRSTDLASTTRHGSTSSLQSVASPKINSPGMSTAPSSVFTTPASSHPHLGMEVRQISGNSDTLEVESRTLRSMISENDMRQQRPPPQSRHSSIIARDKSLPPLPGDAPLRVNLDYSDSRPRTLFTYDPRSLPAGSHDFLPPQAPFRAGEVRRQSFGGMTSRPNVQTVPNTEQRRPFGDRYDEFGLSRHSLGRLDYVQEQVSANQAPTKRRSRFNLSSLLGRKASTDKLSMYDGPHQFPGQRRVGSDGDDATSNSRHSAFSAGPRGSVISRKPLEELVDQDSEFFAYRYPSRDQQLDLLRR